MKSSFKKYLKLYMIQIKLNIKVFKQYKIDTIIGIVSNLFTQAITLVFINVLFYNFREVQGWTLHQILFSYSLLLISKAISHIFFDNLWLIGREYIRRGLLDVFITRPANLLFQILSNKIQFDGLGELIIGVALFLIAKNNIGIDFIMTDYLLLILVIILGTAIIVLINMITSISSFWIIHSNNVMWVVYTLLDIVVYPIIIYPVFAKVIVSTIVPYAFVNYYPSQIFLSEADPKLLLINLAIITILIVIYKLLWKVGYSKYSSSGT